MNIKKQLIEGLIHHKICSRKEAKKRGIKLLKMVSLSDPERVMSLYPHQLSGGMRQRVLIAIAISCFPKLLIADEPTTALDASIQSEILSLLKKIQKEQKMSVVLISHDLSAVRMISDRILVMYGGMIVEKGKTTDILQNPKHPYTKLLLESIPTLDKNKYDNPLKTIQGTFSPKKTPDGLCPFYERCPSAMKICGQKKPPLIQNTLCWLYDKENTSPANQECIEELSEPSLCSR